MPPPIDPGELRQVEKSKKFRTIQPRHQQLGNALETELLGSEVTISTIVTENIEPRVKVHQNMIFSIFDKAFYLNCHLLPVAYPPNVLSNPGDRRQMSVRHSCALENREVDEKITANIPMQRRVVGPVKKVYGCRLARFCVCSQNQGQQVGPAFEKTSVTGTIRARGLVHLGACDSVPGAVANTASRAKSYMKKKKKGGFHVRRRVRTRAPSAVL
jgi:hypothetical protein